MNQLPTVATRIRETRESQGLTQAALAARLDVTRSQITLWETGGRNPSPTSLKDISLALGVDVEWLATGKVSPKPVTSGEVDPQLFQMVVEAVHTAFQTHRLDTNSKRFTQVVVTVYSVAVILWATSAHQDSAKFREHLDGAAEIALSA